ncbi:MAG: hypothetical protein QOE04_2705 [Mycobacterium sp.]|nr:hypothetical protein [Mycobacterium sp.]
MSLPLSDGDDWTRNLKRCDVDGAACLYRLVATVRRRRSRRTGGTWCRHPESSGPSRRAGWAAATSPARWPRQTPSEVCTAARGGVERSALNCAVVVCDARQARLSLPGVQGRHGFAGGPRPSPGGAGRLDGRVVPGLILVRRGVGFEATRSALPKMDNEFAIHRRGTRKTG